MRREAIPCGAIRVFAPASVANFGVGFDILGAALDGPGDHVSARLTRRAGIRIVSISGDGGRLSKDPAQNTAAVAAEAVLRLAFRAKTGAPGIDLWLEKGRPLARGLGSSAASAAAGAFAAATLLGVRSRTRLLRPVLLAEHAADGSWHGDNGFAALLGGFVLVEDSDPRHVSLPLSLPFPDSLRLVLVHPELELPTKVARAVLPSSVTLGQHVHGAAALAGLISALYRGDLAALGRAVGADALVEPARAPLVPGYDAVTGAMRDAGALGWALAGAGPSLMAISEEGKIPETIGRKAVAAFRRAGIAASASVHRIDPLGARLI